MKSNTSISNLRTSYKRALSDYLLRGDETALHKAYELGREALNCETDLLCLVNMHGDATRELLGRKWAKARPLLLAANQFLVESLAPFEMMQTGNRDSNSALRRLNHILEEEGKRIAHVLHDESAQMLASVYLELAEIERKKPPADIIQIVQRIKTHLDEVRIQLRHISHELNPPILDQLGLIPALNFLVEGVCKRAPLTVNIKHDPEDANRRYPPAVETVLYRAVQEALNNIVRHAQATHVSIGIRGSDQFTACTIEDDGIGFDLISLGSGPRQRGLGLAGMQERIHMLSGTLRIDSAPNAGTTLRIVLPLKENNS